MRKLSVGIDVDGVLADLASGMIAVIQEELGIEVHKHDVIRWDYYVDIVGSVKRMLDLMDEAWARYLVPVEEEGLRETLLRLTPKHYHKMILSARTYQSHPFVVQFLHQHGIPYDSLVLLGEGQAKLAYPVHILIDDRPHFVERIQSYPDKTLYLRTQPWNTYVDTSEVDNACRVDSVRAAVDDILKGA